MTTELEPYRGWANHETWLVYDWITRDQDLNEEARRLCLRDKDIYGNGQKLYKLVTMNNPMVALPLYKNLLEDSLGLVDWDELAIHFMEKK